MKKIIPLILASSTLLTACNETKTSPAAPVVSKQDAVASVNGEYISKTALTTLEKEIAQRAPGRSFPKDKLLDELVQKKILVQEAKKKHLETSPQFVQQLESYRETLLAQAAIKDYLKTHPVTDAELKAEYDKNVAASGTEYKARHILLKTEDEAKAVIKSLNEGADFIELAKTKSTGPSGPRGGDLGWFAAGQMVAPFSEATIALEDGKYSTEPVQTQFGWHIILREGSRKQTAPDFESVKEQIRPMLQRKKMQDFMTQLRQQAKVETFLPAEPVKAKPIKTPQTEQVKKSEEAVKKLVEAAKKASTETTAKPE